MRLSACQADPGYREDCIFPWKIFLDGIEQRYVLTADEDKGFVHRFAMDEAGRFKAHSGRYVTEIRNGVVRIEAPPAS